MLLISSREIRSPPGLSKTGRYWIRLSRFSKSDLRARAIYHGKRDSIEAHPSPPCPSALDREPYRLVDQEVRPHRPPLPHHRHPGRPAHGPSTKKDVSRLELKHAVVNRATALPGNDGQQALARHGMQVPLIGMYGRVHTDRPGCGHDPPPHHHVRSAPRRSGRAARQDVGGDVRPDHLPWQTR